VQLIFKNFFIKNFFSKLFSKLISLRDPLLEFRYYFQVTLMLKTPNCLCMHLSSGKSLARASSSSSQSSSQEQSLQATTPLGDLNVSTVVGVTMAMPLSTETRVKVPSTVSTSSPMTRPEIGTFVPPFTAGVPLTTSVPSSPLVRPRLDDRNTNVQNLPREQPYGMPTSMMANVHNSVSTFADQANPLTIHNIHSPSSSSIFGRRTLPPLTTYSMNFLRQQMDESNHEMVKLLTQKIGTVFNPLIRDTNRSYQALTTQMGRIADFFAPIQPVYQPLPQIQNQQLLRLIKPMVQRPQYVSKSQPAIKDVRSSILNGRVCLHTEYYDGA